MQINERLREERIRLGLNQTDFSGVGGISLKAQYNYESGTRKPDTAYLSAIAAIGADVLYILTGQRSAYLQAKEDDKWPDNAMVEPKKGEYAGGTRMEPLTPKEFAILDNYRHSSEEGKAAISATSFAVTKQKTDKKVAHKKTKAQHRYQG